MALLLRPTLRMIEANEGETIREFFERDLGQILGILGMIRPHLQRPAKATFEEFERRLTRHFEWEEHWLFPAVAAKSEALSSTLETMKDEHRDIRTLTAEAHRAVHAENEKSLAKCTVRLKDALNAHALDEGRELFEATAALFTADETAALLDRLPY